MSDGEKEELRDFIEAKLDKQNRRINVFLTTFISIALVFASIAVTFMVKNSREDGIQNTNIENIIKDQGTELEIISTLSNSLNALVTKQEVSNVRITGMENNLEKILEDLENCERAILTKDISHLRGGHVGEKVNNN